MTVGALLLALTLVAVMLHRRSRGETSYAAARSSNEIPRIEDLAALDPRLARAVQVAVTAIERNRTDGEGFGRLGQLYHSHKYFNLARRCYEIAHSLAPRKADWTWYLGALATRRGHRI